MYTYQKDSGTIQCNYGQYQTPTAVVFSVKPVQCCSTAWIGVDKSFLDGPTQYMKARDAQHPPDTYTTWGHYDGSGWTKSKGTTDRYTSAANAFGFTVGTTTTYSSDFQIHWEFGTYALPQVHTPRKIYYLFGTHQETDAQQANTMAAYTWLSTNDDGTEYFLAPDPSTCEGDACSPHGGL
jgi:hypothetical protein